MVVGESHEWLEGEERAWSALSEGDPEDVTRRAGARYDGASQAYTLPFFGQEISVCPRDRRIDGSSPTAGFLLGDLHYLSRVSILWYLIEAKDVPLSGNLVNPGHMNDGLIFASGAHALPLGGIADRYGDDLHGFLRRGVELRGEPLDFGDASLRLLAFPRVPVVLILWRHDEEFPARADLLFDSTCAIHLPTDILWSTAMMSLLVMF